MPASWISQLQSPEIEQRPKRIARVTPQHTVRGMFFSSTFEIVRRMIETSAVDELRKQVNLPESEYSQLKKYPLNDYLTLQTAVAHRIQHVTGTFEEALAKMSTAAPEIFFESLAGRTMKLLAGKDPHRLLSSAPNGYTLAVADGATRRYERTSMNAGVFTFENDLLGPCHQLGVFSFAIKEACGVDTTIKLTQTEPWNFRFNISWE